MDLFCRRIRYLDGMLVECESKDKACSKEYCNSQNNFTHAFKDDGDQKSNKQYQVLDTQLHSNAMG